MTLNFLRCLMCRQFRTYFLLVIAMAFIFQSLLVFYLLAKVKDTEGPTEFGSSDSSRMHQVLVKEKELNVLGKSMCGSLSKTALSAIKRATTKKCKEELSDVAVNSKIINWYQRDYQTIAPERVPFLEVL